MRILMRAGALAVLWVCAWAAAPAHADVVADWIELAAAQTPPPGRFKPDEAEPPWSLAGESDVLVAVAMFQAVNAIERRYAPYREALPPPDGEASAAAAAVAAAHAVLAKLYPSNHDALDEAYALSLAGLADGEPRRRGVALGERAAAQLLEWRTAVRPRDVPPLRPVATPGRWVPASIATIPPFAAVETPWTLSSPEAFRPGPPPALHSAAWARDFNETKRLGALDSTERTGEQSLEARFFYLHRWDRTVRQIADRPGRSLVQNARLYALVAMVAEDAGIAISDGKFAYSFWRPITAIRNADQDGNDATERQADWLPLIPTPRHPEYPCGHCVDSASVTTVLEAEGPPPPEGVAMTSDAFPNVVIYLPSYRAVAERISVSRIWAGAHFRSSVEAGAALGRRIGEHALATVLAPAP